MGAIHSKIKKLRMQAGMTQQETADKMFMHLNTWQKVESGITKLDIDRLKLISDMFEVSVEELINAEEGTFFNEVSGNSDSAGSYNNIGKEINVTNNNCSENERELYERMLKEKDEQIAFMKQLLEGKK